MKALRQGSVGISLSPAARSCAGSRPPSGVGGYHEAAAHHCSIRFVAASWPKQRRGNAGALAAVLAAVRAVQLRSSVLASGPGHSCQIADHCDLGPQREPLSDVGNGLLRGGVREGGLTDVLDRLVPGTGRRHRPGVDLRIRELRHERHVDPFDIDETVPRQQLLPTPGRPSATMAAWFSTFGAAASANGAITQKPGVALR